MNKNIETDLYTRKLTCRRCGKTFINKHFADKHTCKGKKK